MCTATLSNKMIVNREPYIAPTVNGLTVKGSLARMTWAQQPRNQQAFLVETPQDSGHELKF